MICVVITGPSESDVRRQMAAARSNASLVELRVDLFDFFDESVLKKLKDEFSLPVIFTLRSEHQGGSFSGTEEERLRLLTQLATIEPDYLDIECDVPQSLFQHIAQKHPDIKLICSFHDFKTTPEDLSGLYRKMKQQPAHLFKIATLCRNTNDALRLLCWTKDAGNDVISVGMGPHGQITRILGPLVGSCITYASLDKQNTSAPGQLDAKTLIEQYRYPSLNKSTEAFGLIGDPVSGSPSDVMHNHYFAAHNLDCVYVKMTVTPDELPDFLPLAANLPFKGLSVTMPLKEAVIPSLKKIDPEAKSIGAVNTLVKEGSGFAGYNTDGKGAMDALEAVIPVKGKRITLIGAGGAAKAIAHEAVQRGAILTIFNRDKSKGKVLAERVGANFEDIDDYDILINATPASVDPNLIIPKTVIMDVRITTDLSSLAKEKGCTVVPGLNMFLQQAKGQFKLWGKE